MVTNKEILSTVNPKLMVDKRLQLVHDQMLLCSAGTETKEYANKGN